MATSDGTVPCSICMGKSQTKISKSWCPECEDALCPGCEEHHSISKATRNHNTVPIDDYIKLPSFILNLKLECDKHNEKFYHYCKNHGSPMCKKCITTTHKECKDIAVLDDVTSGIKQSFTLESIQQETKTVRRIIKEMKDDRQNNYDRIRQQRTEIIKEISEVRDVINQQLDRIRDNLLQRLDSETKKQNEITEVLINKLKEKENRLIEIQENLSKIIKYASDFQTFLGVKQIEKLVHTEEEYVRLASDDGSLNQVEVHCDINKEIQEMTKHITSFGNINIKYTPAIIDLRSLRENQAQLHVTNKTTINKKQLKLLRRFDFQKSVNTDVTCCCLMSIGDMVFADYKNKVIMIYTMDGTERCKIHLPYKYIPDITVVDDETIAVSSAFHREIILIDTMKGIIKRTINIGFGIWGITFKDDHVIYCAEDEGVGMIDLQTSKTTMLLKEKLTLPSYITTFGGNSEKFALSERDKSVVKVLDSDMKELWRVSDINYLQDPMYIFADREELMYVLDMKFGSVVCISPDGRDHSVLQCDDCQFEASEMSFNPILGQLLVYTMEKEILVFKV